MKLKYPDLPVYYTADTHIYHSNIILYCNRREFMSASEKEMADVWYEGHDREKKPRISRETVARHDLAIIDLINAQVPEEAILVIAGDFCWGGFEVMKRYREAIRCKYIHLIWGNHDYEYASDEEINSLFTWSDQKVTVVVPGHTKAQRRAGDVVLCHEAMWIWDGRHKGSRHYYGHSHARAEDELDKIAPGRFSMDVGVDNAYRLVGQYRPFSDTELEIIMSKRPGFGLLRKDHG